MPGTSKYLLLLILIICICPFILHAQNTAEEIDSLRIRTVRHIINKSLKQNTSYLDQVSDSIIDTQSKEGSWPDVQYQKETAEQFDPIIHFVRLRQMAIMHRTRKDQGKSEQRQLTRKIFNALVYANSIDLRAYDRKWNMIIIPEMMREILLLLDDDISELLRDQSLTNTESRIYPNNIEESLGQIKIYWLNAMISKSHENAESVVNQIKALAKYSSGDGIQSDFSFHNGGPYLHSGAAGITFLNELLKIALFCNNTTLEFEDAHYDVLLDFLLEGHQWMLAGGKYDPRARAEKISDKNYSLQPMYQSFEILKELNLWNDELEHLELRTKNKIQALQGGPIGNRYFWKSDMMVHRRNKYYAAIKTISLRTLSSGSYGVEGLQNYYLSDGSMMILKEGDEYEGLFPLWDWRKIPGVTNEQNKLLPPIEKPKRGMNEFSGGVSDGHSGMVAMQYDKDSVKANKSWFLFDDAIVCLGAGLKLNLYGLFGTTVEQSRLKGNLSYGYRNRIFDLPAGQQLLPAVEWVRHANTVYLFPNEAQLQAYSGRETGSWNEINRQYDERDTVSANIFSLMIMHNRDTDSSYQYIVLPDVSEDRQSYFRNQQFEIVANTKRVQAVYQPESQILQATFYAPGLLRFSGIRELYVDRPCLLIIKMDEGKLHISAADPMAEPNTLKLEINMQVDGEKVVWNQNQGLSTLEIQLPAGDLAGSSVQKSYSFLRGWE